jgi:hypothetical protein
MIGFPVGKLQRSGQSAVDKAAAGLTTIAFGDFDSFVEDDFEWDLLFVKKFVDCQPHDRKIDSVNLIQGPLRGRLFDDFVDLFEMLDGADGQFVIGFLGQKRVPENLFESLDAIEMAWVGGGFHFW